MTRKKGVSLPCSLKNPDGSHDPQKMEEIETKGGIMYMCPECGHTMSEKTPKESAEEPPKETRKRRTRRAAEEPPEKRPAGKRPAYRHITKELQDGRTIELEGHNHTMYRVEIVKPEKEMQPNRPKKLVFFEIFRDEDGLYMGRVSQAVSWERTNDLLYRFYHPEEERYPDGFTWTDTVKKQHGDSTTYVMIPRSVVRRFDVRTDDEISVTIGDFEPESVEGWYHVSNSGRTKVVMLNKIRREEKRKEVLTSIPPEGYYAIINAKPHPSKTRRRDLCHWANDELEEATEKGYEIVSRIAYDEKMRPTPPA